MEIAAYSRVLLRYWWFVAASLAIFVIAAVVFNGTRDKVYESTSTGLVTFDQDRENTGSRADLDQTAKSKATTYAALAVDHATAKLAAALLPAGSHTSDLLSHITVEQTPDTALLSISARDNSPASAAELADAWLAALSQRVAVLEDSDDDSVLAPRLVVVESAIGPESPVYPRPAIDVGIAVLAGLVIGVAGALVMDVLRRRVSSPAKLAETWGVVVLAELPRLPRRRGRRVPVMSDLGSESTSGAAEQLRGARLKLAHAHADGAPRTIVVSSPAPGQGTSTVALDLAAAFAAAGQPVILVEAGFQHPTMAQDLDLDATVGLWQVLESGMPVERALQTCRDQRGLRVLVAGASSDQGAELLGSASMHALIEALRADHLVIIDAPAVLESSVAPVLCQFADGIIVVTPARPSVNKMTATFDRLAVVDAPVLGVVVDHARRGPGGAGRDRSGDATTRVPATSVAATAPPQSRSASGSAQDVGVARTSGGPVASAVLSRPARTTATTGAGTGRSAARSGASRRTQPAQRSRAPRVATAVVVGCFVAAVALVAALIVLLLS